MFSTNGRAKRKRDHVSRIYLKNKADFLNLQTANTRKIEMREEIGSETKYYNADGKDNDSSNNDNIDWLKDKVDKDHFHYNKIFVLLMRFSQELFVFSCSFLVISLK